MTIPAAPPEPADAKAVGVDQIGTGEDGAHWNGPIAAGPPRGALIFVLITILLDTMALGMVLPVLPHLITQLLIGHPLSAKLAHRLHRLPGGTVSAAAVIYGLFNTVFALMQFFFSPAIGTLSDRFGRRPLILASNIGLGLNYLLMAGAPTLQWLFVGRMASGITGASIGTASAYIADTTPPEGRPQAFGLLGAAFGLGLMLGPAIGGLLGEYSIRAPFVLAGVLSLANGCYGFFVLPESLARDHRHGFSWRRANPVGALGFLGKHRELLGLATVGFLSNLAQVSLPSVVVLYAMHRYGWTTGVVGLTMASAGIAVGFVQVVLVGRVVGRFGDRAALIAGLLFGAAGLVLAGLAPDSAVFWTAIPLLALWGLSGPVVQAIMTRHVKAAEQGRLQGANTSLTGISELAGPLLFTLTFAYFVNRGHELWESGAPFVVAALILVGAAGLAVRATRGEGVLRPQG